MKKLKRYKFKDYPFKFVRLNKIFAYNYEFFYPKPLLYSLLVIVFALSFKNTKYIPFFCSLLSVTLFNLASMMRQNKSFKAKRMTRKKTRENLTEEITYILRNPSGINLSNIILLDFNEAHYDKDNKHITSYYFGELNAHEEKRFLKKQKMNNGMGDKNLGPLYLSATDVFGIERFSFLDNRTRFIRVFPEILSSKLPKLIVDEFSENFGLFDARSVGENVNFYSTREYVQGDRINKINWKLSLKTKKVIVNEFEKNTNASVMAIYIDHIRFHFGQGVHSSFEYCQDLILSLFYQAFKSNNAIGFLSHQRFLKPSVGRSHFHAMEYMLAKYQLKNFAHTNLYHRSTQKVSEAIQFEKKIFHYCEVSSSVFIFIPFFKGKVFSSYLESIVKCLKRGYRIEVVLVYGFKELIKKSFKDYPWLFKLQETMDSDIAEVKSYLRNKGVKVHAVEIDNQMNYHEKIRDAYV